MSDFILRSFTAVLYVVIMLGAVWAGPYTLAALFLLISLPGMYECNRLLHSGAGSRFPFLLLISGLLSGSLLFLVFMQIIEVQFLLILPVLLIVLWITTLFDNAEKPGVHAANYIFTIFYLPVFLMITLSASLLNGNWDPFMLTGLLIILWLYDTGAYVTGSLTGRKKLFPRISPAKTVEGVAGGGALALASAMLWAAIFNDGAYAFWAVAWLIICTAGTFGDLFESLLKRRAGVKDSGKILPGHGGVLDRFDALLFAGPAFAALLALTP